VDVLKYSLVELVTVVATVLLVFSGHYLTAITAVVLSAILSTISCVAWEA